jgi:hypothetical protein
MRTRYYYRPEHPKANERGFVEAQDMGEADPTLALNAPILMDRFYENTCATDGTDIGSRRKHRDYMKAKGLTIASDFTNTWAKAAEERTARGQGTSQTERKAIREEVGRALYQRSRP